MPAWPLPAAVHPLVVTLPPEVETSIASVAQYIAAREPDRLARVRAFHDYAATRIVYAVEEYNRGAVTAPLGDAQRVFESRRAVCGGYARLVEALGRAGGVPIVYVLGKVRLLERGQMRLEDHAWNAVFHDGQWLQFDATWDAGRSDGDRFLSKYSTEYLFTPADVFAYSHLARRDFPQLRPPGFTETTFRARPVLEPSFFAHGVRLVSPLAYQNESDGRMELSFQNPLGAAVHVVAVREGGGGALCRPTHCGETACLQGQVCVNDSCVDPSCTAGLCSAGKRCRDRQCVVVACRQSAECYPTETCRAGRCEGLNAFGKLYESARSLRLVCELKQPGSYRFMFATREAGNLETSNYRKGGAVLVTNRLRSGR